MRLHRVLQVSFKWPSATPHLRGNSLTTPAPAPDIFTIMLPALIGFCGVIFGGVLQVVAKHRADRYLHMTELRKSVAEFLVAVAGFATAIVQSATMIDGARARIKKDLDEGKESEEPEGQQDYLERLGEEMFSRYRETVDFSTKLMAASDERIADQAGDINLRLADVINEVGYMHTGTLHVPEDRAKEIQAEIMKEVNVLLNMIAPRWWEKFWNFRSAKSAERILAKEHKKALDKGFKVGKAK